MTIPRKIDFGSFHVDLDDARLWRGGDPVHLTNKAFHVLQELLSRPGQLVTREKLLNTVWTRAYVSDAALAVCVRELRRALQDDAREPHYIETVRGRGYRFVATVQPLDTTPESAGDGKPFEPGSRAHAQTGDAHGADPVGRLAELQQLQHWLQRALARRRHVGFIAGEAGIGKTTLVDTFTAQAGARTDLWVGHGQCIQHYGAGEPYLPILEALTRLCRDPAADSLRSLLKRHAPSWVPQMPALLDAPEPPREQPPAATRQRMLRELAEAVEIITAQKPLLLVLEDLQWCDTSTLEWLAYVTRRRDPARLLVLATYRPVDVIVREHPLRSLVQDLKRRAQCSELMLDYLPQNNVADYLRQRAGGATPPDALARELHRRTNGNPLFMVTLVDTLLGDQPSQLQAGEQLVETLQSLAASLPETLRQLIEQQLDQLSPQDLALLEAASVAGAHFSAAAVAAAVVSPVEPVEARLAELSRRGAFLRELEPVTWPDGTVSSAYAFVHTLFEDALYARVPAARRSRLHAHLGAALEAAYRAQAPVIATELAMHFVRGSDPQRAVDYLLQAGGNALQLSACDEAIGHFEQGLGCIRTLPEDARQTRTELRLQNGLAAALVTARGYAWPETGRAFLRARELCALLKNDGQTANALYGLCLHHLDRGAIDVSHQVAEEALSTASRDAHSAALPIAYRLLGTSQFFLGEFDAARKNLERALALYEPGQHRHLMFEHGTDLRVTILCWLNRVLCLLGRQAPAEALSAEARSFASELSHAHSVAYALRDACFIAQFAGDAAGVRQHAEAAIALAREHGFSYELEESRIYLGWAVARDDDAGEGLAAMRRGLSHYQASGSQYQVPYFLTLLADASVASGKADAGLVLLEEALERAAATREHWYTAEIHRLRGQVLHTQASGPTPAAHDAFCEALDTARRQRARALELRAATALSRLWVEQGEPDKAHALLAPLVTWFENAGATPDSTQAARLLDEL